MVIGFVINNILRDHISKLQSVYYATTGLEAPENINPYDLDTHFPNNSSNDEDLVELTEDLIISEDYKSMDLIPVEDDDTSFDAYQIMYIDASFEIFGSSEETIPGIIKKISALSKISKHDLKITNLESSRSKCATLFFLSKNGFDMNEIYFPDSRESMWEKFDVIVTDDPKLINLKPKNKKVIKVERFYNDTIDSDMAIPNINDIIENFDEKIEML